MNTLQRAFSLAPLSSACLAAGTFVVLALLTVTPGFSLAQTSSKPQLRAGAAKVDITPARDELARSTDTIRDHLFVRAIVVENGGSSAVLVAIDAGGVRNEVVNDAIERSSAATGIPHENYIICATHTHSGSRATSPAKVTAAIVSAVDMGKSKLAPARVGYGTAQLDLNVNRDLYNDQQEWRQGPNPAGLSDKTLAVVAFVGDDGVPIGVFMNYGMHPINFYLSGVVSADFPGEASRYVEELFDDKTVALFSQGTSGDQNPRMGYAPPYSTRAFRQGRAPDPLTVTSPRTPPAVTEASAAEPQRFNPATAAAERPPISPALAEAYQKVIGRVGNYVTMLGHMIGATAERVMREDMQYADSATIWAGQRTISVPGRIRNDRDDPARENVFPGYSDGPDVNIKVGLLRVGDIHFVTINGEVYTSIGLKLKQASPANKTIVVTLANGRANSGYIYSDDAYHHLTFQVIGSRLKPGYAEKQIIWTALSLIEQSTAH